MTAFCVGVFCVGVFYRVKNTNTKNTHITNTNINTNGNANTRKKRGSIFPRPTSKEKKIKMPQLDQVTFFSQYFWLCFFFFTFYLFLYKHFLPKMSRILKYRKRKVELSQQGMSTMEQENEKAASSYQTLLFSGLSHSASLFDGSLKQVDSWLSQVVDKSNHAQLGSTNRNYIYSLGEKSLSSQLALSHPFAALPQKLFISSLLGTPPVLPKGLGRSPSAGSTKENGAQSKSQQFSTNQKGSQTPDLQGASKKNGRRNTAPVSTPPLNQAEKVSPAATTGRGEKGKKKPDKKSK